MALHVNSAIFAIICTQGVQFLKLFALKECKFGFLLHSLSAIWYLCIKIREEMERLFEYSNKLIAEENTVFTRYMYDLYRSGILG